MYGSSHLATLRKALTEGSTSVVNKKYEQNKGEKP